MLLFDLAFHQCTVHDYTAQCADDCSAARNFTPNFSLIFTVCHCELPAVQVLTDLGITPDAMPLALITSNEHESVS
jgi:hypothetical protein